MTDRESCCPAGQCYFRPEMVERFLETIRQLRSAGLDVSSNARSALAPCQGYQPARSPNRTPTDEAHYALVLADVIRAARSATQTIDDFSHDLCPYAHAAAPKHDVSPSETWLTRREAESRLQCGDRTLRMLVASRQLRRWYKYQVTDGRPSVLYAASEIEALALERSAGR